MKKILVSACLYGNVCRYKGDSCFNEKVSALGQDNVLIPVCPEQLGGDVTGEYTRGAKFAVEIAKANNVDFCVMKANSPSCGKGVIYDGTFTGGKTSGNGLTTEMLLKEGFKVFTEDEI